MSTNATPANVGSNDGLGVDPARADFEAWAYVRDFDVARSSVNALKYASERTQGAWNAWCHGTANWMDQRDKAVQLLRECLDALEHHREQTRPIQRNEETMCKVRRALGLCERCGLPPGCPDCKAVHDVPQGA